MVHRVMEVAGKTTGSPSFANTASNWLRRHFVRTVLKPKDSEKEIYHTNVRDAQDLALRGWNLVLALPFFNTKEHKNKLLFDLAQIPIFQSKPLVVLSCLLELKHTILGFTSPELKDEIQQIAMRSIRRVEKKK